MSFSFTDNDSVQLASDLENSGPILNKDVIKIGQKKKKKKPKLTLTEFYLKFFSLSAAKSGPLGHLSFQPN